MKTQRTADVTIAALLIAGGSLLLAGNYGLINFNLSHLWPLFLLIPGLAFHYAFFVGQERNPGLLVPGGMFTTYGLLFLYGTTSGWYNFGDLWGFFPLGVAFGLLELYIFGGRQWGLLIPIGILGTVGLAGLSAGLLNVGGGAIIGGLLVIMGGLLLTRRDRE